MVELRELSQVSGVQGAKPEISRGCCEMMAVQEGTEKLGCSSGTQAMLGGCVGGPALFTWSSYWRFFYLER